MCMYVHPYIYLYISINVCMYTYIYICSCKDIVAHVYVDMSYVHMRIYIHIHTDICTCMNHICQYMKIYVNTTRTYECCTHPYIWVQQWGTCKGLDDAGGGGLLQVGICCI